MEITVEEVSDIILGIISINTLLLFISMIHTLPIATFLERLI